MNFIETRGNDGKRPNSVSFSQAILNPMASFGGLYVPEVLPQLGNNFLCAHQNFNYKNLAQSLLATLKLDIDAQLIEKALSRYDSFDDPSNPAPLRCISDNLFVSELFHGPTRAFKDMALQPFGEILSRTAQERGEHYLILAATSGDTGPATLDTFKNLANVKVACLYPEGGTSDVQRLQMITENAPNLKVIGIQGDFDQAQGILKSLLSSNTFNDNLNKRQMKTTAANSVNIGRVIFQLIYHFHSYLELVNQSVIDIGDKVYLNVPSANFGNALSAYYAMKMGLPVEKIIISSNRNNILTNLINDGCFDLRERKVHTTNSPAMDVLKSSNIERILFDLYGTKRTFELMKNLENECYYQLEEYELMKLQNIFSAGFASDTEVNTHILETFKQHDYLIDPHTATCFVTQQDFYDKKIPSIVYSTAEWTKFSPTMVHAISHYTGMDDVGALRYISKVAKIPIPQNILKLFDKPITQPTSVEKSNIEREILNFV